MLEEAVEVVVASLDGALGLAERWQRRLHVSDRRWREWAGRGAALKTGQ